MLRRLMKRAGKVKNLYIGIKYDFDKIFKSLYINERKNSD